VGLGDADLGVFPLQFRGAPAAPELFVNDARMTLARWPNEGWATVAGIADPGTEPNADEPPRGGAFEYDGDRPARWDVKTGVWLVGYWGYDWYEEAIQVRAIDVGQRQIALAAPHVYTIRPDNPAPRRYRALNLLEELDEPGEYYIDRAARVLYFWPPEDLTGARISLSTLREPLIRLANCRHVTLRGLTVQEGLGCGIAIADGQSVAVEACTVRNVRDKGITIDGGVEHRVEACDLYGTGTGGVVAQGGDRRTLTPARHVVLNCHIHHFSCHQRTYASAIHLHGVGNRAAYNLVHDAPHMAIGLHGNDHLVEGNVVHHVCIETDDCGALYKGRDPSGTNNVIRHNFWHHIGNPLGHGNAAVYLDDGDVGDRIVGNVFFRCGEPGKGNFGSVFSHGGHDNTVDGNLFIECRRAIGSSPWSDKARKKHAETFDWRRLLLEDVDIARPPYTTRYPWLIGYWDMLPDRPRQNRARQNVFVMCGEISSGNWTWSPEENLVTDRDPGFRDAAAGDFRLDTDAAKGGPLAAIARIPFARLGLYASPLRPEPEREPWPYPPPKSLNG